MAFYAIRHRPKDPKFPHNQHWTCRVVDNPQELISEYAHKAGAEVIVFQSESDIIIRQGKTYYRFATDFCAVVWLHELLWPDLEVEFGRVIYPTTGHPPRENLLYPEPERKG